MDVNNLSDMKKEDFELVIIKSKNGGYTAFTKSMTGLVVEAESTGEIPSKLAKAFENMMEYALINNFSIHEIKS